MNGTDKKDRRLYVTPDEVRLLHDLMMGHVAIRIESRKLEPWESHLLTKMGKASARAAKVEHLAQSLS